MDSSALVPGNKRASLLLKKCEASFPILINNGTLTDRLGPIHTDPWYAGAFVRFATEKGKPLRFVAALDT